ncbi:hypothetical protein [Megasphaera elsdenii]|uniref:hypothetical protein n=1 Tax=Megasphaera elsdenii TaxID=907 RepID=UPI0033954CE4
MKKSFLVALIMSALLVSGCGNDPSGDISKATGISKDQANAVLTQLKDVGVTEFDGVSTLDKDKGYYYIQDSKYGRVFFGIKDGKLVAVENQQGVKVYASDNKICDLADVTLTDAQVAEYQVIAQNTVKDRLKAPSTADFDNIKVVKSKDGSVLITGTVDAQNSFGAKLRKGFMVTVDVNKQVSSVNFL